MLSRMNPAENELDRQETSVRQAQRLLVEPPGSNCVQGYGTSRPHPYPRPEREGFPLNRLNSRSSPTAKLCSPQGCGSIRAVFGINWIPRSGPHIPSSGRSVSTSSILLTMMFRKSPRGSKLSMRSRTSSGVNEPRIISGRGAF